MLNVHHLELFYYVARHQGISEAARRIPYGIQQPAISSQIGLLEQSLGLSLFQRRPFLLTPAGKRLYEEILPFFSRLDSLEDDILAAEAGHLRLGASASVLSHHIPEVLHELRHVFPALQLTLKEIPTRGGATALVGGEIDVALTVQPTELPSGILFMELLKLPLILLLPTKAKYRNLKSMLQTADGQKLSTVRLPLISLPESEPLATLFQQSLSERLIHWPVRVEVTSAEMGIHYAAAGFGAALHVDVPGAKLPDTVRKVPLPGFPQLCIGALTHGEPKNVVLHFCKLARKRARQISK